MSDDVKSYNDLNIYDGDSEDNQQHNHYSARDWDHDPEIEESEDDNIDESNNDGNRGPNDIDQVEEDTTLRIRTRFPYQMF